MKTHKGPTKSSRNKNKVFGSSVGENCSDIEPCYKIFLEHLRKDGEKYVFDVPDGDHGMPASVKYGEDGMSSVDARAKDASNTVEDGMYEKKKKKKKNTSAVDESYAEFLSLVKIKDGFMVIELQPGVTIVYEQELEGPPGSHELRTGNSTKVHQPLMTAVENMENGFGQTHSTSEHRMDGPASNSLDSQDLICIDEHRLVPYSESSNFIVCEGDKGASLSPICGGPSTFDEKLNSALSKPYDQNEYEELLRKATDRQPVSRQRNLRSASKRYATGVVGLSYLDHYTDLALQIHSADCNGRLRLLRKFFFWLENLCHEGAHMPWMPKALACNPIAADD